MKKTAFWRSMSLWALLWGALMPGACAGWVDGEILVQGDPSAQISLWQGGGRIENGQLVWSAGGTRMSQGGLEFFKQPFKLPQEQSQFIRLHFKIYALADAGGRPNPAASARIFLAPDPLPGFLEPYGMPNALILLIARDTQGGVSVSVYSKVNQAAGGYGANLYTGLLPENGFPLGIDLYVNSSVYQVVFDRDVLSSNGSRSGYHGLPPGLWNGSVWFGVRAVNHEEGVNAQVGLGDFRVGLAKHQE